MEDKLHVDPCRPSCHASRIFCQMCKSCANCCICIRHRTWETWLQLKTCCAELALESEESCVLMLASGAVQCTLDPTATYDAARAKTINLSCSNFSTRFFNSHDSHMQSLKLKLGTPSARPGYDAVLFSHQARKWFLRCLEGSCGLLGLRIFIVFLLLV